MIMSDALGSASSFDVGERVAVDQDQVGELALLDRAEIALGAHRQAAVAGGADQRLGRRCSRSSSMNSSISRAWVPCGLQAKP